MTTLEKQIETLGKGVLENPDDVDILRRYAQACFMRDFRLEALQSYQRLLEIEDKPEYHLALAIIYVWQKYWNEAWEELRKLFALDATNVGAHIFLVSLDAEAMPEDIKGQMVNVPSRKALQQEHAVLISRREELLREIEDYDQLLAAVKEPEPVLCYYQDRAKKRVDLVESFIVHCCELEERASDEPVLSASSGVAQEKMESQLEETSADVEAGDAQPDESVESVGDEVSATEPLEGEAVPAEEESSAQDEVAAEGPTEEQIEAEIKVQDEVEAEVQETNQTESVEETQIEPTESVAVSESSDTVPEPAAESGFEEKADTENQEGNHARIHRDTEALAAALERFTSAKGAERRAVIIDSEGQIVAQSGKIESIIELVQGVNAGLDSFKAWPYHKLEGWTLEFNKRFVFIQELNEGCNLVVDTSGGTLAALRKAVDAIQNELRTLL